MLDDMITPIAACCLKAHQVIQWLLYNFEGDYAYSPANFSKFIIINFTGTSFGT